MIDLVIFDLDGTLIRLPVRYDFLRNELKGQFQIEGEFFLIPTILNKTKGNEKLKKSAFDFICTEEYRAIDELVAYEGSVELLRDLHVMNKKLALVTLQCRKAALKILDVLDMKDLFSNIFTREDYTNRYDQIINTMDVLKIDQTQTLMVGDRINDFESATKAGCQSIIIRRNDQSPVKDMHFVKDNLELKNELIRLL